GTSGLARHRAQAPFAGLHRRCLHAVPCVQGNPDGGADGERAGHGHQPPGGAHRPRAQPAAHSGRDPRAARRFGDGEVQREETGREDGGLRARASIPLVDQDGKKSGTRELPAELFEASVNVPLMHQVVVAGMAAARRGTASTKTRAEVRGGGKKPWRQKGTGRARHGSIRSPIWTGGGVAHGPKPRDYSMRVNKKMKKAALRSALTDTATSGKLALVDRLEFDGPSTRDAVAVLDALGLGGRVLLV